MLFSTHVDFTQIPSDIRYVLFQEIVQDNHMGFLGKKDVVSQVLHNLGNNLEATSDDPIVLRHFNIHYLRRNNGRGNKSVGVSSIQVLRRDGRTSGI